MFIETQKLQSDLLLKEEAKQQLKKIENQLTGKEKKSKTGFSFLFIGPGGSGKKTAAALLGKSSGKRVHYVNLSKLISKYIGETEKNLNKLFSKAELKDWILFFDEADALFGKRSNVKNSHDRYANIEINYLLQKIQDHPGPVFFAAKSKSNIDDAFRRRFQTIVHFIPPSPLEVRYGKIRD